MATKKSKFSIDIKQSKEGSFTQYCKKHKFNGVTQECIAQAKKSKSPAIRKKAVFAQNAKKWHKPKSGGKK